MNKPNSVSKGQMTRSVFTWISMKKYAKLKALTQQSDAKTISELLRKKLEKKKVVPLKYDRLLETLMWELSAIRKELHLQEINIRQIQRLLDDQHLPEGMVNTRAHIADIFHSVDLKISILFNLITKISYVWLPE